jgi:hypothetical protein
MPKSQKKLARTRVTLSLPTFAVLVLEQRAKDRSAAVAAIVEELILENIMVPEVERMMKQSPEFARIAKEWMQSAEIGRK